jgi:hypothetical protein
MLGKRNPRKIYFVVEAKLTAFCAVDDWVIPSSLQRECCSSYLIENNENNENNLIQSNPWVMKAIRA